MVTMRQGLAQPVVARAAGAASFLNGSATTVGSEVVPVNLNRAFGVYVQATSTTDGRLLVGSTTADAKILLETFGAANSAPNAVWIYGTGAVFIKGWTVTANYAVMEY